MILETNMMNLTFESVLQMSVAGSLRFENKLNLTFAVIILFSLALYSVLFYPLIYQFCHRQAAETLLVKCNYQMTSFFVQSFSLVSRNFFRSFIHSFLLQNYKQQILVLAISDVLCCFLCCNFRSKFTNKLFFALFLTYNIVFFIVDMLFVIYSRN